jgi:hypothetical protein
MSETTKATTAGNRDFSAESFIAWEKRHKFNWQQTAEVLGCNKGTIYAWRKKGAPFYIGLACAAIDHGLHMPDPALNTPSEEEHPDLISVR